MNEFEAKKEEWEQLARINSDFKAQVGRPFDDGAWNDLSQDVLSKLSLEANERMTILDVGCGNGLLLSKIADRFSECYGVDYSHSMIAKAKELLPSGQFYQSDAQNLNFNDKTFDRVLSYSIFHYFPSYEYALSVILQMIRVTKVNGVVLIGDLLDSEFEADIKGKSDLAYEEKIPLIHRYSQWRFYDFERLASDLKEHVKKVEILSQPTSFPLSSYRKDLRLWV